MKTAVILAAGLGSRLKTKTQNLPKGFLEIADLPIIERSILNLLSCGIEKIFIGTGYLSKHFDLLKIRYPQIVTIKSDKYESTGSMYTLYNMRELIQDDFLLLESDLLYELDAIKYLLYDSKKDIVLASGFTQSGDEVFIEVDNNLDLVNMSKKRDALAGIYAELVGISKISRERYIKMNEYFESVFDEMPTLDYESAIVASTKYSSVFIKKIENLVWCEIDDDSHLKRALEVIYPRIQIKEVVPVRRNILLNPGPATTSNTVKMAQVVPDICPRETEFGNVMEFVSQELTSIVANTQEYTTILFGGSGTAAVEAILTSVIPHDKKLLIINNGAYGQRMCQIAARYKIGYVEFKSSPVSPVDLDALKKAILGNRDELSHLSIVHNETTTGLLNNLSIIGEVAKEFNLGLIVDAMSSYAAVPIDMEKQNIAYLAASSNKNIQAMAGVSFVVANKIAIEGLKSIEPRSFYLSLYEQYTNFIKTHQMRFTPPVQTIYALRQAIIEAKREGIENRYKRYSESWECLTRFLKANGLEYLVEDRHHSKIITSIKMPSCVSFNQMHDHLKSLGFTIYPGKVEEFDTFRIANIGEIDKGNFLCLIPLFAKYLEKNAK